MKYYFLTILFICYSLLAFVQERPEFRLQKIIQGDFVRLAVDPLQQIYLLSSNGQLLKKNLEGDSLAVFNEFVRYGKKADLDVSNPLRPLIYYSDYANLVLLDRFLGKRAVLDLRRLGFYQVGVTAQSYDNGIWMQDLEQGQLIRLNESGQVQDRFTDFRRLFDSVPQPKVIFDQGNFLYLYDPNLGFYLFDHYGAFKKRVPMYGWKDVNVLSGMLFGRKEQTMFRYDTQRMELHEFPIPGEWKNSRQLLLSQDHIFVLLNNRLEIYALPGRF